MFFPHLLFKYKNTNILPYLFFLCRFVRLVKIWQCSFDASWPSISVHVVVACMLPVPSPRVAALVLVIESLVFIKRETKFCPGVAQVIEPNLSMHASFVALTI